MEKAAPHTKTKIIRTVRRIMGQGGVHPSMSEIAKKSGVTKSTLYYFFKDQKDLYHTVMHSIFSDLVEKFDAIMDSNDPPRKRLLSLMDSLLAHAKENSHTTQLIFHQLFSSDEKCLHEMFVMRETKLMYFRKCLDEALREDPMINIDIEKAVLIIDAVTSYLALSTHVHVPKDFNPLDIDALSDYLLSLIFQPKK